MAVLTAIDVLEADLARAYPNLQQLQFENVSPAHSFAEVIADAKVEVFGILKKDYKLNNPTYTEAEIVANLLLVKDVEEEYIKQRIVNTAMRRIFTQNEDYEAVEVWGTLANRVPLIYHIDLDEDDVVDQDEERNTPKYRSFHR